MTQFKLGVVHKVSWANFYMEKETNEVSLTKLASN